MPFRQQIFALIICVVVFAVIVELVRRRRLREEFSILWLTTSVMMFVLVLKYDWLLAFTLWVGAGFPTSVLFLAALVFLALVAVQFSIKISQLADQVKNLCQDNALMRYQIELLGQKSQVDAAHSQQQESKLPIP